MSKHSSAAHKNKNKKNSVFQPNFESKMTELFSIVFYALALLKTNKCTKIDKQKILRTPKYPSQVSLYIKDVILPQTHSFLDK